MGKGRDCEKCFSRSVKTIIRNLDECKADRSAVNHAVWGMAWLGH